MLVVGFFLQTDFDFLPSHFDKIFKNHSRFLVALRAYNSKDISPVIVFVKLWGFQDSNFCQLGHLTRDIIRTIDA